MSDLKLYNTLTRQKEVFVPEDENNVRMYVCGPTVYDFAHIGNARPVIVFDVLFRLLRHKYGEQNVTYVRNITDVDDKINARAKRDYPNLPLNEAIRNVTEKTAAQFHADVKALGCLSPTHEPRATEHIDGMISIIQTLLDKEHAYVADGGQGKEVLFRVSSMENYGTLSNRVGKLNEQQEGARVAVESHKENAGDFVLWKQSKDDEPGWSGEFNSEKIYGRPGWHIECSAMSEAFLGKTFDIHGGGLDLIFPHHENEIAQSCCAHGTDKMASVWMHNGYVQVEGKKMSKSDGNFVTIRDLVLSEHGDAIRWLMFKTHYRQALNFRRIEIRTAANEIMGLIEKSWLLPSKLNEPRKPDEKFVSLLCDDLNTPGAIARLYELATNSNEMNRKKLRASLELLGIRHLDEPFSFNNAVAGYGDISNEVFSIAIQWKNTVLNGLSDESEILLSRAEELGWMLTLNGGSVNFSKIGDDFSSDDLVELEISKRLQFLKDKNFAEADRIRDELLEQGIQLKDGRDPETGERVTTWEVKR